MSNKTVPFIPLVIDSKYHGLQIIHVDLLNGYSIACKISALNDTEFDISESMLILSDSKGGIEIPYYGLSASKPSTHKPADPEDQYAYVINTDFTFQDGQIGRNSTRNVKNNKYVKKKPGTSMKPEIHLIDVKIDKNSLESFLRNHLKDKDLIISHGQEFCRFYII